MIPLEVKAVVEAYGRIEAVVDVAMMKPTVGELVAEIVPVPVQYVSVLVTPVPETLPPPIHAPLTA